MMKAENLHANNLSHPDPGPGPHWFRPLQVLCMLFGLITLAVEIGLLALILYASTLNQNISQIPLTLFICILGILLSLAGHITWLIWSPLLLARLLGLSRQSASAEIPKQPEPAIPIQPGRQANTTSRQIYTTGQNSLPPNHTIPLQDDPRAASALSTSLIQAHPGGTFAPRYGLSGSLTASGTILDIVNFRSFALPREGTNIEISADKQAFNASYTRYALADGVGTSFLPGRWAEIITQQFVMRDDEFQGQADFEDWLRICSQEWHTWVNKAWLPVAIESSGQTNWNREIARGASSTLVGCSFSWKDLLKDGATRIQVTAVGDAVFFLVSPDPTHPTGWISDSYYLKRSEDFTQESQALGSAVTRIERDWKRVHQTSFSARHNDIVVLATDALAQWIMKAQEAHHDPWKELFSINNPEHFRYFVQRYRDNALMEVDDTTVMIIPLSSEPYDGFESK